MRFIMQISFLRCCFSSVLVLSKTHDFNIIPCYKVQAVAQKQQQMLEELNKIISLEMRFIMQISFLGFYFWMSSSSPKRMILTEVHVLHIRAVA